MVRENNNGKCVSEHFDGKEGRQRDWTEKGEERRMQRSVFQSNLRKWKRMDAKFHSKMNGKIKKEMSPALTFAGHVAKELHWNADKRQWAPFADGLGTDSEESEKVKDHVRATRRCSTVATRGGGVPLQSAHKQPIRPCVDGWCVSVSDWAQFTRRSQPLVFLTRRPTVKHAHSACVH